MDASLHPPLDVEALHNAVANRYGAVALDPTIQAPFPVGRTYAEAIGYPPMVLDMLPSAAVASFTGESALVTSGVSDGDRVVTLGVQKLEDGEHVRTIDRP